MEKPKSLDTCDELKQAIDFILDNEADQKKQELVKKLSELVIYSQDIEFRDGVEIRFKNAIKDASLSSLSDEAVHNKARDLAFQLFQLYAQRSFIELARTPIRDRLF